MTRADRIFGSSKTAAMLRADETIAEGMAALGRALEKQIARQDRAEKRAGKAKRPAPKRKVRHG